MAKATLKRRPWAVEMKPPGQEQWYELEGFGDKFEADSHMQVIDHRFARVYNPELKPELRVRDIRE